MTRTADVCENLILAMFAKYIQAQSALKWIQYKAIANYGEPYFADGQ